MDNDKGSLLAAELCLRERWPARHNVPLAGWLLRWTLGSAHRPNSVWTGGPCEAEDADWAISSAEAFYRAKRQPVRFQMLEAHGPADLDHRLQDRGYVRDHESVSLQKPVEGRALPPEVTMTDTLSQDWHALYANAQNPARLPEHFVILSLVQTRSAFIVAWIDDMPAAVALAGLHGQDVAVDCVMTRPDLRRSGGASRVMQAAEAWAFRQNARRMLLTVAGDNHGAAALYRKLGYRDLSHYYFRIQPAD